MLPALRSTFCHRFAATTSAAAATLLRCWRRLGAAAAAVSNRPLQQADIVLSFAASTRVL